MAKNGGTSTVEVNDETTGAKIFREISKSDLTANGKIQAQGASHYARMSMLVQNIQNMLTMMAQDKELQLHFPSTKLAKAFEELLEFGEYQLVELYGRVAERLEAQRLAQAADKKLQQESGVDTGANVSPGAGQAPSNTPEGAPA